MSKDITGIIDKYIIDKCLINKLKVVKHLDNVYNFNKSVNRDLTPSYLLIDNEYFDINFHWNGNDWIKN